MKTVIVLNHWDQLNDKQKAEIVTYFEDQGNTFFSRDSENDILSDKSITGVYIDTDKRFHYSRGEYDELDNRIYKYQNTRIGYSPYAQENLNTTEFWKNHFGDKMHILKSEKVDSARKAYKEGDYIQILRRHGAQWIEPFGIYCVEAKGLVNGSAWAHLDGAYRFANDFDLNVGDKITLKRQMNTLKPNVEYTITAINKGMYHHDFGVRVAETSTNGNSDMAWFDRNHVKKVIPTTVSTDKTEVRRIMPTTIPTDGTTVKKEFKAGQVVRFIKAAGGGVEAGDYAILTSVQKRNTSGALRIKMEKCDRNGALINNGNFKSDVWKTNYYDIESRYLEVYKDSVKESFPYKPGDVVRIGKISSILKDDIGKIFTIGSIEPYPGGSSSTFKWIVYPEEENSFRTNGGNRLLVNDTAYLTIVSRSEHPLTVDEAFPCQVGDRIKILNPFGAMYINKGDEVTVLEVKRSHLPPGRGQFEMEFGQLPPDIDCWYFEPEHIQVLNSRTPIENYKSTGSPKLSGVLLVDKSNNLREYVKPLKHNNYEQSLCISKKSPKVFEGSRRRAVGISSGRSRTRPQVF